MKFKKNIIKILFFIIFVIISWFIIDFKEVIRSLSNLSIFAWVFCALFVFIGIIFQGIRLKIVLKHIQTISLKNSITLCFISFFFSQFLPGSVGGDIYKWSEISRIVNDKKKAISAIFADRIFGLYSLFLMSLIFIYPNFTIIKESVNIFLLFFCASCIVCGLSLSYLIGKKITFLQKIRPFSAIFEILSSVSDFIFTKNFIKIIFFSILSALFLDIMVPYFLFNDLNIQVNYYFLPFMIPIVTIVNAIPISFAGWGTREALFIAFGTAVNISSEKILAISIAIGGITLISSLLGGLIWLFNTKSYAKRSKKNKAIIR